VRLVSLLSSSTTQTLGANIPHFKSKSGASPPLVQNRNLVWATISSMVLYDRRWISRVYRSLTLDFPFLKLQISSSQKDVSYPMQFDFPVITATLGMYGCFY
jgi:hypothetical protein